MNDVFLKLKTQVPFMHIGSFYKMIFERDKNGLFINDLGISQWVSLSKFDEIKEKKIMKKQVKCIDQGRFSNLQKGKVYDVIAEANNFIIIKNKRGFKAKYHKKYFEEVIPPEAKKESGALCVLPTLKLTYNKRYVLNSVENEPDKVYVINDHGEKIKVLKKRFK